MIPVLLEAVQGNKEPRQFIIPGTAEMDITEPGRYYLWNEFNTIHEGKTYRRSKAIPDGLGIMITDQDGRNLPLTGDSSITTNRGSSSMNSIGYVEVIRPAKLTVTVSGSSDKRVFSFSPSIIMKIVGLFLAGLGFSILFPVLGVGLAIWGVVKLSKSGKDGKSTIP